MSLNQCYLLLLAVPLLGADGPPVPRTVINFAYTATVTRGLSIPEGPTIPEGIVVSGTFAYDLGDVLLPQITAEFAAIGYRFYPGANNKVTVKDTPTFEQFEISQSRSSIWAETLPIQKYYAASGITLINTNPEVNALQGENLPLSLALQDFTQATLKVSIWNQQGPGGGSLEAEINTLTQSSPSDGDSNTSKTDARSGNREVSK